jgi:nitrogenase molybdenum-iron protein beta chain
VFGGNDKLRDTVANALKIIDADLFVILTGCTSELIGDDIAKVASEFKDAPKPVLFANTPGFKGNNYVGHDWILKAIFEQYLPTLPAQKKQKGLVNLFVGQPVQDPYWLGNLREIESLLRQIGLTPNTIFGHGRGVKNIDLLPAAEYNILVSPWVGLESARYLADTYGAPLLHYPVVPIGAFETTKFLRAVGVFTGADKKRTEAVIKENEDEYYYFIERFADTFLEMRIMSKRFVTVSDAEYSLAVTKFFVNDLGMFPMTQFITDDTPKQYRPLIEKEFSELNYGIKAEVEFITEGRAIHDKIRKTDFAGIPMIVGTSWEHDVANEIYAHHINISYPLIKLVMNSHLTGYSGGLKLIEDMYSIASAKLLL